MQCARLASVLANWPKAASVYFFLDLYGRERRARKRNAKLIVEAAKPLAAHAAPMAKIINYYLLSMAATRNRVKRKGPVKQIDRVRQAVHRR